MQFPARFGIGSCLHFSKERELYVSMKLVREVCLANGLTVSFFNHNHRYFGDYHQVRVEITCEVPIHEQLFAKRGECEEARGALGGSAIFRRSVEKMGVPSAELEIALESIIENFCDHSLPYLASPEFPRQLIAKELAANSRITHHGTYPD